MWVSAGELHLDEVVDGASCTGVSVRGFHLVDAAAGQCALHAHEKIRASEMHPLII